MTNALLAQQLLVMLGLQDEINSQINPEWRIARNPWYRAIWTECAELADHVGWKWWKRQPLNVAQVHLEIVDIFHFGLSDLLQGPETRSDISNGLASILGRVPDSAVDPLRLLENIETFALATLASRKFDPEGFGALMRSSGLSTDTLYRAYVSKNVLNRFRQDHGYKSGSYIKTWAGREDNEWLDELASGIDARSPSYSDDLYAVLQKTYAEKAR
jgi:dimeric dUTPase (all-alpha-NTP-PPase superfamily)